MLTIQLKEILGTIGPLPTSTQTFSNQMLLRKRRDMLSKHKNHPNAINAVNLIDEIMALG